MSDAAPPAAPAAPSTTNGVSKAAPAKTSGTPAPAPTKGATSGTGAPAQAVESSTTPPAGAEVDPLAQYLKTKGVTVKRRDGREVRIETPEHLLPVHVGQTVVQQHQLGLVFPKPVQRRRTAGNAVCTHTLRLEAPSDELQQRNVILDDEDRLRARRVFRHGHFRELAVNCRQLARIVVLWQGLTVCVKTSLLETVYSSLEG